MPTNIQKAEFVIEAVPSEADTYTIRVRVRGMYEVRSFLNDNGISDRRIALAIEELGRSESAVAKAA
jgi:hypothetical protein